LNRTRDGAGARLARLHTLFWLTAGLSACGGGGPNTGESPFPAPAPSPAPASATAQSCAPSNPYRADALQPTTSGSLANEKAWLRRYMDAAYLWTAQIPSVNAGAAPYSDTGDVPGSLDRYFEALKTPALTASGKRLDQFSFTYPTKAWNALFQSGEEAGYGALWAIGSDTPPRSIRIVRVESGSPAALAGLRRGDTLVSVDGVSADTLDGAGIDTLNSGLYPAAVGESHRFVVSRGAATVDVTLRSAVITQNPVPLTTVLQQGSHRVGYLVFNDHIAPAETALIAAVRQLQAAGVDQLVLDLRYNGGGYLYIASELAYMIAGGPRTQGQVFEALRYNSRRAAENSSTPFFDTACVPDAQFNCTDTQALPTLALSKLTVLTSGNTCSASEAIVNGLRGVDVEVTLIGDTTCGKPYGFTGQDNCGISYFPIEFQGVNAKGFGDYADGFSATCAVADDLEHALGDPAEGQLAAALTQLATGSCPAIAKGKQARPDKRAVTHRLIRGPQHEARIVAPVRR
jgi:hypothetical protein